MKLNVSRRDGGLIRAQSRASPATVLKRETVFKVGSADPFWRPWRANAGVARSNFNSHTKDHLLSSKGPLCAQVLQLRQQHKTRKRL